MGQIVPYVKDDVSPTFPSAVGQYRPVADWLSQQQFDDELCARVARLRQERDWTQAQMATALGIPVERYKKYEVRSALPHFLIPRFAQIVDRDVSYVLTGTSADKKRRGPRVLARTGTDG